MSGIYVVPRSLIVDKELRLQGSSLDQWAKNHGIGAMDLCRRIERGKQDAILSQLAETLGISVQALTEPSTMTG